MSRRELSSVAAQPQMKLQAAHPSSPTKVLVSSLASSAFLASTPDPQQPESGLEDISLKTDKDPSFDHISQSSHASTKTTPGDGYNWQKYGEKQVKGIECTRSYYRCSQVNCQIKKHVVRCYSGHVIEIMYKGQHNHEPPRNIKCTKESWVSSEQPSAECETANLSDGKTNGSTLPEQTSCIAISEQQLVCRTDSDGGAGVRVNVEHEYHPRPRRRMTYSTLLLKTTGEAKVVVHTNTDLGASDDGYKWRKYGQKIVKGNPNPRSYYKCTHYGCPARKHVERASDDAKTWVVTYEGEHNHEQPACMKDEIKANVTLEGQHNHGSLMSKKCRTEAFVTCETNDKHEPLPSKDSHVSNGTALLIAAAAAMTSGGQSPSSPRNQSTARPLLERDDDVSKRALELGGENALESAKTLLSIKFDLNSSGGGEKNLKTINNPQTDGNQTVTSA